MKILVISNLYPPNAVGGYERMCFEVSEALVNCGNSISVLTSNYGHKEAVHERQLVLPDLRLHANRDDIYAPFAASPEERAAIDVSNDEAFDRAIVEIQPDVIFVWNLYFLGASLLERIQACGRPAVLFLTDNWLIAARAPERIATFFQRHVHGSEPFAPSEHPQSDLMVRASAVFGSDFMRDLYHQSGFAFDDEVVIHNGVHMAPSLGQIPSNRASLRTHGEFKLLFAGRIVEIKGASDAVKAVARIKALAPPDMRISLTIVGDTQDVAFNSFLTNEIIALGVQDQVRFEPPVPESALPALFEAHDAYLFPSLYEPFSLTLIHALYAGIPTVASAIGGNTEIVQHGRTGMLFAKGDIEDFAEQILRLMLDPALRCTVSQRGRNLAARFTFDRMMERLGSVLKASAGI